MDQFIFTDLNIRLSDVDPNDNITIIDSKVIKQSLEKLVNTAEGSIPYYRSYGLNLKQFMHYTLDDSTGQDIFNHIKDKIEQFIKFVTILEDISTITIDYDNELISIQISVQSNSTGEVITLEPVNVPINT